MQLFKPERWAVGGQREDTGDLSAAVRDQKMDLEPCPGHYKPKSQRGFGGRCDKSPVCRVR